MASVSRLTPGWLTPARQELGVKLLNVGCRLASMVAKFGLSVMIARYLDLAGLGTYGIVFALSMFMVVFLGGRIDHDLCRRIVLASPADAARMLRDQSLFYLLNIAVVLPGFAVAGLLDLPGFDLPTALLAGAICGLEAYGNLLFVNTNALGKSLLANLAFFVRSGLWALIAMVLLVCCPSLRTLWMVLLLWIAGSAASIWLNLVVLGIRRWPSPRHVPVDRAGLRRALSVSFLIWIGSIGLAGGTYLDRLVLGASLDLKAVGVATFYSSFSNAAVALVASSSLAVAIPKLVRFATDGDRAAFVAELKGLIRYSLVLGSFLCLVIAIVVPMMAGLVHKPEIYTYRYTLWLLMAVALLRLTAEGVYGGLYALHRDVPIWMGNMLFMAISLLANILLIGQYGLIGLGVANVLATLFLLSLRTAGLFSGRSLMSRGP